MQAVLTASGGNKTWNSCYLGKKKHLVCKEEALV